MDEERLNEWRVLFGRALAIIDAFMPALRDSGTRSGDAA